jgi:hypothetical protein
MDLHLSPDMWNIVDTANGHESGGRAEHTKVSISKATCGARYLSWPSVSC